MKQAWFEYKGINSLDKFLKIENDVTFSSPESDIEFVDIKGRDGELAIDHQRLKGVQFSIPVRLKLPSDSTINEAATEVSEWLKNGIGWFPLSFSGSPDYEYLAICYEQFNIKETLKQYGRTVITFKLKPYKRRTDNGTVALTNGSVLDNPEKRAAKPLIYIEGTGNIVLKNNGKDWLILNSVDGHISIDSEQMSVYKNNLQQFQKMNANIKPLFPLLLPGNNKITWTGAITKIEIAPRWEAVV